MNAGPSNPLEQFTHWLGKHPGSALVYFALLPTLACLALILPPLALPSRIGNLGYTSFSSKGVTLNNSDGAEITIPEDAVKNGAAARLATTTLEALNADQVTQPLPSTLDVVSPVYQI